jgi:hypothetical protein
MDNFMPNDENAFVDMSAIGGKISSLTLSMLSKKVND